MTDKEIRALIKKRRKDWRYGNSVEAKYKAEECKDILELIDSLQEEPISVDWFRNNVWHKPDENPFDKSKVVVWTGEEMVQCSYIFGKFKEKTPTEEHGRYVDVGNREDPGSVFISKRSRADLTDLVVKWAYIDDLLNNPDKKEPVSEDLEKEIDRIWRKIPDSLSDTIYWKEFDKIARHFANWQKQQLMKGAISAEIFDNYDKDICQHHMEILADIPDGYKDGEKVKLVIIKEE